MKNRLNANEFFTGFFAVLALHGRTLISLRDERFEAVIASLFTQKIGRLAAKYHVDLRFRVRLDPFHGTSATVRDAVTDAAQRGIISLDNPVFQDARLKLGEEEAAQILSKSPVSKGFFEEVAHEFCVEEESLVVD